MFFFIEINSIAHAMYLGETGLACPLTDVDSIFFFSRKGAKPCLRKAGAKNLIPKPKNLPRRTSLRIFSAYICVKNLGFVRSTTADRPAAGGRGQFILIHIHGLHPWLCIVRSAEAGRTSINPRWNPGEKKKDPLRRVEP